MMSHVALVRLWMMLMQENRSCVIVGRSLVCRARLSRRLPTDNWAMGLMGRKSFSVKVAMIVDLWAVVYFRQYIHSNARWRYWCTGVAGEAVGRWTGGCGEKK